MTIPIVYISFYFSEIFYTNMLRVSDLLLKIHTLQNDQEFVSQNSQFGFGS